MPAPLRWARAPCFGLQRCPAPPGAGACIAAAGAPPSPRLALSCGRAPRRSQHGLQEARRPCARRDAPPTYGAGQWTPVLRCPTLTLSHTALRRARLCGEAWPAQESEAAVQRGREHARQNLVDRLQRVVQDALGARHQDLRARGPPLAPAGRVAARRRARRCERARNATQSSSVCRAIPHH